jgi:hypothetical protein
MFDPVTASLLRSAPEVPGLDPADIPQLLTRQYAALVSARMRGSEDAPAGAADFEWPLERIADTYELVTSISNEGELRRASAFVAATAHQILARRQASQESVGTYLINRDGVAPALASALLFLAAEQYADANEAANSIDIPTRGELYESRILADHIRDLAKGNLSAILDRGARWRRPPNPVFPIEAQALIILLEALASGIEILAAEILARPRPEQTTSRFDTSHGAFTRVLQLSSFVSPAHSLDIGGDLFTSYPGPRHMASLLRAAHDGIRHAAITAVPPPVGADQNYWNRWLQFRANLYPYVWPNHREAIQKKFYETNVSAVMVLPTGAGKTTVSAIKIAGALARGKKVVFLAPTHALVEQLTGDLQDVFPKELLGSAVSSDFDLLAANTQLQEIEVMTPERCLAMLSFAPAAFEDVGLLVFDECHLLSPQSGKIRRALDGMLCLLAFNHLAPQADLLFLSAMLDNGAEFTEWITELTGRRSIFVDLLWKPSRQARGVIIYSEPQLESIRNAALQMQTVLNTKAGKSAKGLRTASKSLLVAEPRAIWGLQHNWLSESHAHCSITSLADEPVTLSGDIKFNKIRLTPNANQVAARLAVSAARNGLKTIVFVNTKAYAVSTAHEVSIQLADPLKPTELEKVIWDALEIELGGLQYSLIEPSACAVPHNSSMFRLERDLAERMFRRDNGAKVIVATPTLAQGLNLPAQLAILAGDKRADSKNKGRENLEAHELLNAAARAGRAGHLANGVVLLIPEPNISYTDGQNLDLSVIQKLRSILPEDDRCVSITDPLEVVLDRLMSGQLVDRDVKYTLNRMAALNASSEEDAASIFNLNKSLGFYAAKKKNDEKTFNEKIETLKSQI